MATTCGAQGTSVHVAVAEDDEGTAEDGRGHMCLCGMSYRPGGTWREGRLTDSLFSYEMAPLGSARRTRRTRAQRRAKIYHDVPRAPVSER